MHFFFFCEYIVISILTTKGRKEMSDASRRNNKKYHDKESFGLASLFVCAIKSALIALGISLVLAAALSAASTLSSDPLSLVFPMSLAALYISSFLSGFLCMRKMREGTLLCGLFSGGIFMLIYMFISLFFPSEMSQGYSFLISLLLHSLIILFSLFGAHAGRHKKTRKRKR